MRVNKAAIKFETMMIWEAIKVTTTTKIIPLLSLTQPHILSFFASSFVCCFVVLFLPDCLLFIPLR